MSNQAHPLDPAELYDRDFYRWAREQTSALRERQTEALDFEHLAEEVEGLALSQRRELQSRLRRVLVHLLKYRFQAQRRSRSWESTLLTERREINDLLELSPSLRSEVAERADRAYPAARRQAGTEMRMTRSDWEQLIPDQSPWTVEQILDLDYVPEAERQKF